jgi:hypothetical protein
MSYEQTNDDLLYIEDGYFTPDGYYVYTALAKIGIGPYIEDGYIEAGYYEDYSAQSGLVCDAEIVTGELVDATGTWTSEFAQTTVGYRIIEAAAAFTDAFTPSLTADAFKNHTAILETAATMTVDAQANRSADITLATIGNLNSQAVKTTDIATTIATTATQTTAPTKTVSSQSNISSAVTLNTDVFRVEIAAANINSTSTLSASSKIFVRQTTVTVNNTGAYDGIVIDSARKVFGTASARFDDSTEIFPEIGGAGGDDTQIVSTGSAFYLIKQGYTWSSSDGTTWTRNTNDLNVAPNIVSYSNGNFTFISGDTWRYSTDALSWSQRTATIGGNSLTTYFNTVLFPFMVYLNGNWRLVGIREVSNTMRVRVATFTALTSSTSSSDTELVSTGIAPGNFNGGDSSYNGTEIIYAFRGTGNSIVYSYNGSVNTSRSVGAQANARPYRDGSVWAVYGGATGLRYSKDDGSTWTNNTALTVGTTQYKNGYWIINTLSGTFTGTDIAALTKRIPYGIGRVENVGSIWAGIDPELPGTVKRSTNATTWNTDLVDNVQGVPGNIIYAQGDNQNLSTWKTIDFRLNVDGERFYLDNLLKWEDSSDIILLELQQNLLYFKQNGTTLHSWAIPAYDQWFHIRISRDGSTVSVYQNGARQYTGTITAWPVSPFRISGEQIWVDEFLATKALLTAPSVTSFTVPTLPYNNNADTLLLLHFDSDFSDDSAFYIDPEANLSSATTISVTATPIRATAVTVGITATSDVNAVKVTDVTASLAAEGFTVTIGGEQQSATIAIIAEFTVTADVTLIPPIRAEAEISSETTVTAAAERLRDDDAQLVSSLTLTAVMGFVKTAASDLTLTATVTANTGLLTDVTSDITADTTQSTAADRFRTTGIDTTATAAMTTAAERFRSTASSLQSVCDVTVTGIRPRTSAVTAASDTTVTATVFRLQQGATDLASEFDKSFAVNVIPGAGSTITVTATLTATVFKTTDVDISAITLFTPTIDADITARPLVFLETTSALSTIIGSVKQFEPRTVSGARSSGDYYPIITIQNPPSLGFGPRTAGFCASIWMKLDEIADNQMIWGDRNFPQQPAVALVIDRNTDLPPPFSSTQHRIVLRFSFDADEPQPAWIGAPTDTDWHHYLLWAPSYARPTGVPYPAGSWFRLWVDGEELISSSNFHQASYNRSFNNEVVLGQAVLPNVDNPFFSTGYQTEGSYAQLWMGLLNARQFSPIKFYDQGFVDLGTDGRYRQQLTNPYVYNLLDQPFDSNVDFITNPTAQQQISTEPLAIPTYNGYFDFSAQAQFRVVSTGSLQATTESTVTANYTVDNTASITADSALSAQITQFTGIIADLTSDATVSTIAKKFNGFDISLNTTTTVFCLPGFVEQFTADLTTVVTLDAAVDVRPPIRTEAFLTATATATITAISFTDNTVDITAIATLTADVTVIPPVRIDADLISEATVTALVGVIKPYSSSFTADTDCTATVAKFTGFISGFTVTATVAVEAARFRSTPIALEALAFQLSAGRSLALDPFRTLMIKPESRSLMIYQETREITINAETRVNIIEGY